VIHEVVFAPEAQADLLDLYETIAREGGGDRTLSYVERIQGGLSAACSLPSGAPDATTSGPGCA
jgi:plasmid stabilization system protein ParE